MISRIRQRGVDALGIWRTPLLYGASTAVIFWCVWYFTKIPCTPHNAAAGLCNPGWLSRFINVEILALAVGAGIAIGSVKGGYDYYMLKNMINQEREDRLKKEQELRELISELRDELREARSNAEAYRQRLDEERRQADEERRHDIAERRRLEEERRQRLDEERRQADEERRHDIAERRRLEEERRQRLDEERRQADEERRRVEEERRQTEAEERRLAAEDRARSIAIQQAMLEAIMQLAQNGNGNGNHRSD